MKEPSLSRLTFADSGVYVCEASVTGLVRRSSFQLIVEGQQPAPPCFLDTGWVPPPLKLFLLEEDVHRRWDADRLLSLRREAGDHRPVQAPRRRRRLQGGDV